MHTLRSLGLRTDLAVLGRSAEIEARDGYLVVRSPRNPRFHWGNLLVFPAAPQPGDGSRWETLFESEFAASPAVTHRTFTWDTVDADSVGAARSEFVSRGYTLEDTIVLTAPVSRIEATARANREVQVIPLATGDPSHEAFWDAVVEIQVAGREPRFDEAGHRAFSVARQRDLRQLFAAGNGTWYVAVDPTSERVVASCGIVARDGLGRYQSVDTIESYRRRGIASRLVAEAARHAAETFAVRELVILAETHYHALPLYESLGFEPTEHLYGVSRSGPAPPGG
ncbi:MAG: GNAT family N-acetyltransferase [Gaiellales bacterium]